MRLSDLDIPRNIKLFANGRDPGQMQHSMAFDWDLYCLPVTFWGSMD